LDGDMKEFLENLKGRRVVLASGSPRRCELLFQMGLTFDVDPVKDIDESFDESTPVLDVAPQLARRKALAYLAKTGRGTDDVVISADTVVIVDNRVLGKPRNVADACGMLRCLSGRTHLVVTGVDVEAEGFSVCRKQVTEVTFANLTDEEIRYYVDRYKPFDKAGAYGVQEWIGYVGVAGINGDYYNVMGLPLRLLYTILKEIAQCPMD